MCYRPSGLRKKGEAVVDAKYAGKKGSRNQLYGNGDSDGEEQENSEASDEEQDEDEDEEMGDFEDLEDGEEDGSDDGEDDGEEQSDDEDDEEPKETAPVKKVLSRSSKHATTKEQDEKAMMKQLKQAASADIDKGRDVKKQLVS